MVSVALKNSKASANKYTTTARAQVSPSIFVIVPIDGSEERNTSSIFFG